MNCDYAYEKPLNGINLGFIIKAPELRAITSCDAENIKIGKYDLFNPPILNNMAEFGEQYIEIHFLDKKLKYFPYGPIDSKLSLVQVLTAHQRGGEPSPAKNKIQLCDVHLRRQSSIVYSLCYCHLLLRYPSKL